MARQSELCTNSSDKPFFPFVLILLWVVQFWYSITHGSIVRFNAMLAGATRLTVQDSHMTSGLLILCIRKQAHASL
jgi:nitrate/nitrite transporter NarK